MGLVAKQYAPNTGQVRMFTAGMPPVSHNNGQQQTPQTVLPMTTVVTKCSPNTHTQAGYYQQSSVISTQPQPPPQRQSASNNSGSILSQLRSWQRSRKLRSLNKNNSRSTVVNPMNNLCYQSMNPLRGHHHSSDITNLDVSYKSSSSELISLEACSTSSGSSNRSSITDTQTGSPVVSFRNQGDGQIAMHLQGSPGTGSRLVHLNESQLYALQAHFLKNAQDIAENCYASLEPPTHQLREDPHIAREPWFYGSISREKAVETLHNCPTGSFVVRTSGTNHACYALTLRVPHDFNHTGVSHYLVLYEDSRYRIKGFSKEFETISSLIVHHSIMKEQLPCTLRLQESCLGSGGHHYHTVKSHYRSSPSLVFNHNNNNNSQAQNNNNNNNNHTMSTKYGGFYGGYGAKSMTRLPSSADIEETEDVYNKVHDDDDDDIVPVMTGAPPLPPPTTAAAEQGDDPLMVDVDEDPTYQKILDNFRKTMAVYN